MEKRTEVQCRVQYLSTNADALVTRNPTKAQSIPSPQRVPCALSSQGQVWYLYTYMDQCTSQGQGHTLTQAWQNCQNMDINNANNSMIESTDLIRFTHFLTIILLEKDTFLHWMQSRITHHTYLNCHLSLLQSGDSCSHWASTSLQTRLCRLPSTWVCLSIPQDIQPQK